MQAWTIEEWGRLALIDLDPGPPGPGQVRMRVRANSLNYRDLLTLRGHYNPRQRLPLVIGSDAAGEVEAVGPGVTEWKPGDRVCPIFAQDWLAGPPTRERLRSTLGGPFPGVFAQVCNLPAQSLVTIPEHLDFVEAACLPCAAVTAWSALVAQAHLAPGNSVLLIGTGGVSLFALQFAQRMGLRSCLTSRSADKLKRATAIAGGDVFALDTSQEPGWGEAARRWSGSGVDLVVEVGGADTLDQSLSALRVGGQISLIGVLAGGRGPVNLTRILMNATRIVGILVGSRDDFLAMNSALTGWGLRPHVDRAFPAAQANEAFEYLAQGQHLGKICLTW